MIRIAADAAARRLFNVQASDMPNAKWDILITPMFMKPSNYLKIWLLRIYLLGLYVILFCECIDKSEHC